MIYAGDEVYGDEVTSGLMGAAFPVEQRRREEVPDLDTLEEWVEMGEAEATDGCVVEPDGKCQHGHQSWLLELGLI
jgi:hypothetical protein